jgi:uncharacterized protein YdcH (DUF465 family)
MPSNQELTQENKVLRKQLEELKAQLTGDVVQKTDYDKLKEELEALKANQPNFPTLKATHEDLQRKYQEVVQQRDTARNEVVAASQRLKQLESSVQKNEEAPQEVEQLNISTAELRSLAALCLMFSKDESGRPLNKSTLKANGAGYVSAALELAKEFVRQSS